MSPWRILALVPAGLDGGADPFSSIVAAAAVATPLSAAVEALLVAPAFDADAGRRAAEAGAASVTLFAHAALPSAPTVEQVVAAAAEALAHAGVSSTRHVLVFLPPAPESEEVGARLAVRLDAVALGRCAALEVRDDGVAATRPAFGGRVQVHLACAPRACFASMRASAPANGASTDVAPRRVELTVPLPDSPAVQSSAPAGGPKPLEGARLVVCGGRGIGGEEGMAQLAQVAEVLGGVVAGSLPAVDAGWVGVSQQVGQSGRYVTPDIYLGVGVSGTPQHMAGIGPDTRVVAINSDPAADIFREAEAGLVADWREAIPALLEKLRAAP